MQGTDILEALPLLIAHSHSRGVQLGPACVTPHIQNALILEAEWPINVRELLLKCSSYNHIKSI